jgi:hypothetical protein
MYLNSLIYKVKTKKINEFRYIYILFSIISDYFLPRREKIFFGESWFISPFMQALTTL